MDRVSELLTDLAACLCAQIREDGLPEPCFCGVMPGERVAIDYVNQCEEQNGMAWTRLSLGYPATGVGVPSQQMKNCGAAFGVEIEMGVMRAAATMNEQGEPPSEAEQLVMVQLANADMLAMHKAVACCETMGRYDYILSQYRPSGPFGGAVGGFFTVMVAL